MLLRLLAIILVATIAAIAAIGLVASSHAAIAAGIVGEILLVLLLLVTLGAVAIQQQDRVGANADPAVAESPGEVFAADAGESLPAGRLAA